MEKPTPPITLRPAAQTDVGFIFNSWLKSYKYSLFARTITNTIYFSEHHKLIEKLLKSNETIVACNPNDPEQIYGYVNAGRIGGVFCLNYIYVKQSFRGLGIGKSLLNYFEHDPSSASVYTHHTRTAEKLAPKYNMIYHPYLILNTSESSDEQPGE